MASNDAADEDEGEPRRPLNPWGASQIDFGQLMPPNLDLIKGPALQQLLGNLTMQAFSPDVLAELRRASLFPNVSEILAANRQTLLEQMQPNTGALLQSVLTDSAIRSWQKQPRTAARKQWTARKFLTANSLEVSSVQQFTSTLAKMSPRHSEHELVWRGQGNADWPVRSTLSRAVALRNDTDVATEDELVEAEADILASAQRWGLNPAELAPAPLHTLAELQHVGAPTRLLDVTLDPEIAAWFAVENDELDHDGLLIAWGQHPRVRNGVLKIQSTSEVLALAGGRLPWHDWDDEDRRDASWGTGERTHVWFPTTPNKRMIVQRGGFMIESGPMLLEPIRKTINSELTNSTGEDHDWRRSELERATSVIGLPSPIGLKTKPTDPALVPIFTILIKAGAKADIREHLRTHGLEARAMYPDLSGLVTEVQRNYPTS